jgi:hypothetical protein
VKFANVYGYSTIYSTLQILGIRTVLPGQCVEHDANGLLVAIGAGGRQDHPQRCRIVGTPQPIRHEFGMTEITMSEHVKALQKARAKLVESRRAQVPGLATPGQWSSFNEIQRTIEQIDRAIVDEQLNALSTPIRVSDDYDRRWPELVHPDE